MEEGEKQRKLEEDKVKHNKRIKEKRKHDEQEEENKKTEERSKRSSVNVNDKVEAKLSGTRNLRDLINSINLENLKDRVKRMFYHGYKNYM